MTSTGPILIAYDGSDDARHAIDHVATMLPGAEAVVLYVRQPLESLAAHMEGHPALEEVERVQSQSRDSTEHVAAAGAEHARRAGLDAAAHVASATEAVGDTVVHVADELDARATEPQRTPQRSRATPRRSGSRCCSGWRRSRR